MATPNSSACAPVRAQEISDTTVTTQEAPAYLLTTNGEQEDPALQAAVQVVAEQPQTATAFAEGLGVGEGALTFSAEEAKQLRNAAFAHGMWSTGKDPVVDKLLGEA